MEMEIRVTFGIIIPARYASTRFPGKPLADIGGKSMVQRVYEIGIAAAGEGRVAIATDDMRIYDHVVSFGGKAVMTSSACLSGTDRCLEAYQILGWNFDVLVNIQGDEPFIQPEQVRKLASVFHDSEVQIASLKKAIEMSDELMNPNVVKVVTSVRGNALYFSRSAIPHHRAGGEATKSYKHLGMYAYRSDVLKRIGMLPQTALEKSEMLEQLRWLENGYTIRMVETLWESPAVDTPEDLQKVQSFI